MDLILLWRICQFDRYRNSNYISRWVTILYQAFYARIQNNGRLSNKIRIEKGVHQGGCTSTTLFLLCAEILAIELRSDNRIQGIPVGDIEHLLGQFADNMDIYQLFNAESLEATMDKLAWFKKTQDLQ